MIMKVNIFSRTRNISANLEYIFFALLAHNTYDYSCNILINNLEGFEDPGYVFKVANKFSELFVVNCLISLVSSPHYLKIKIKSTKHGLSYSLKVIWGQSLKLHLIQSFVNYFLQKYYFLFKSSISW